jgi:nascent polypeptide-associated complex subunit alpha
MRRNFSPREAKRMMQRMGLNMDSLQDVEEVIIKTNKKEIVIQEPEVAILNVQGQKMFQVIGGKMSEKTMKPTSIILEEDIRLVADQTGKSLEEARKTLEECEGDLAKAILLLQSKI